MKYKDWLDVWFANYIEPSSKTKTCERYSEIIEKHLKVKLGEYELEELSPIVIQKYITELMQSGNLTTGKGLAANSVNGIITVIQNSLKLAYMLGELKEYTADKIRRPKTKEKEVSCFSLAEQKKIEQAALSSKKRKFIGIVICLYSGLRIGELLALTWTDIDFTKGTLAVNKTCHDGRDENGNLCRITDLPKTTSSKRMIPLPKQLLPVLKEYKRKSVSEYVVESEKGEPPTVRSQLLYTERSGILREIRYRFAGREYVNENAVVPGAGKVEVSFAPGDDIDAFRNGTDRIGQAIFQAASNDELQAAVKAFRESLRVEVCQ